MAKDCPKCGNLMNRIPEKVYAGMGRYKTVMSDEWECSYCIWKGDAGPGKLLRDIIKEANDG